MTDPTAAFAKMVPGFDFLQGLVKGAGAAIPSVGQWVAPTLDPEELDKRIGDLRTVQFWLEQNARMLATTIQALEVQRMTLSTLKTMNVSLGDLTESLKIRVPEPAAAPAPPPAPRPAPAPAAEAPSPAAGTPVAPPGVIDPVQWWGALTQQFTELAANAMKEGAADAARNLAGAVVQQGLDAAAATLKQAGNLSAKAGRGAAPQAPAAGGAGAAAKPASRSARATAAPARPAAGKRAARKPAAG